MSTLKTKAVIFPKADDYAITELELDSPKESDVVVRTLISAISPGTERWTLRGKHIGTKFPCAPGYQRIGIVEQCGSGVGSLRVGDVVYGSANRWKGDVHFGWGAHVGLSVGDHSEYRYLASSIPNRLDLDSLAFAIVACVANRGIRFSDVRSKHKVLIIGAGIIGVCAAQLAAARGATPVLLEQNAERAAFVKRIIPNTLVLDDSDLDGQLSAIASDGFDLLYDTVGHAGTTDRMVQKVRPGGMLLLQAQYFDREHCAIDLDQIKIRELTIKTTCGLDGVDWLDTVTNIRNRTLLIAPLITHRFEAADALKAFALLDAGQPFNMGMVLRWDERVSD